MFNNQRDTAPTTRKRFDAAIVIAGLLVALILAVLTWFNYQDHWAPANAQIMGGDEAPKQ